MEELERKTEKKIVGQHLLIDLMNIDRSLILNNVEDWINAIKLACIKLEADILLSNYHIFEPPRSLGFTAFVLLDSSHISIHTYADFGRAALDIFVCNDRDIYQAFDVIKNEIGIGDNNITSIKFVQRFE